MASELYVETLKGLTSGANANKVIIPSGQTLDASAGSVVLPAGAGGKVLQVVQQTYSTQASGLTTSFSDTGLSASITPSSTSSKILVIVSQSHYLARQTNAPILMFARLLRDSTVVFSNDRCMGLNAGTAANGYIELYTTNNISHLDSPSTTSSLTYKTQVSLQTTNNNGGEASQPNNQPSTITLMEIAG